MNKLFKHPIKDSAGIVNLEKMDILELKYAIININILRIKLVN